MLNLDVDYATNIFIWLMHSHLIETGIQEATYLTKFRKKRKELAWALLHIMNAAHLHNDHFPHNIMFHFPQDESRVYIAVCNWSMTTIAATPSKSLYTFTSASDKTTTLARRG